MRQKKAKQLRKYILDNTQEFLLKLRNEYGKETEKLGGRQIYQRAKKMYYNGKLNI